MTQERGVSTFPILTGPDGRPYLRCDYVDALLRSVADTCRMLPDQAGALAEIANLCDIQADALACRTLDPT